MGVALDGGDTSAGFHISSLMAHEHVYREDGDDERPSTGVVVDAVAALLRGEYEVREPTAAPAASRRACTTGFSVRKTWTTSGSLLGVLPFWPCRPS